jgi:hypothetical protein
MSASVTSGALFFLTIRMFRGGDGHCKDTKSLLGLTEGSIVFAKGGEALTLIARHYPIFQDIYIVDMVPLGGATKASHSAPPYRMGCEALALASRGDHGDVYTKEGKTPFQVLKDSLADQSDLGCKERRDSLHIP